MNTDVAPRPLAEADPVRRYATLTFVRGAFVALAITLLGGLLGVLYTVPAIGETFKETIDFAVVRPLHTIFALAWIFLGGIAVVHRYLQDQAGAITAGDRWRLQIQVTVWAIAGLGILISVSLGITSGREYMGFHPVFSVLILVGWICFAWNFFRATWKGFWFRPVYVTMWGVGCLFFIYTFLEQHAYLLPGVFEDPVMDKRIQWKATGTLVGSFNLFVYGAMIYMGEKLSGDSSYGHSKLAYALFGIGLLNTFTNFAHHTYHVPQNHMVTWIAFVVSMLEILILCRVAWDVARFALNRVERPFCSAHAFLASAKWWIAAMLFTSILIAIPPLNSIIHGTYVVTAHAMGTTIGIDSFVLMGALTAVLAEILIARDGNAAANVLHTRRMWHLVVGLNVSVGALILWLSTVGIFDGVFRYLTPRSEAYAAYRPEWLSTSSGIVFAVAGLLAFIYFMALLRTWLPLVFLRFHREVVTTHDAGFPQREATP